MSGVRQFLGYDRPAWHHQAACADHPDDWWFPYDGNHQQNTQARNRAVAVCTGHTIYSCHNCDLQYTAPPAERTDCPRCAQPDRDARYRATGTGWPLPTAEQPAAHRRPCPVLQQCLESAVEQGPTLHGIWAGTDQPDRARIRNRRQRKARLNRTLEEGAA